MRFVRVLAMLVLAAVMLAPAAMAQDESQFKISLTYIEVMPTAKDGFLGLEAQSGGGGELAFEYYMSDKMGLELAAGTVSHEIEDTYGAILNAGDKIAEISQVPVFLNMNFHLVNTKKADFWLGGGLAMAMWDDLELEPSVAPPSEVSTQTDFGITLNGGLDIRFGERFALVLGLRYYEAEVRMDDENFSTLPVSVDPFVGRIGASVRF
jgi:outer membrane protein W